MTIFDLGDINAQLYARVAYDASGAAIRSQLGGGSPSVIPAAAVKAGSLPDRPFMAWRGGVVGGSTLDMRQVTGTWYIYDDIAQRHGRINAIMQSVQAAYREDAIPFGRTEISGIGQEFTDQPLDLNCRTVQITHYRRG